jgi:uncharacterized protein (DUF1330 family)
MNIPLRILFASLAGVVVSTFAVQTVHAQSKSRTYYIAEVASTDSETYVKEFASKISGTVEPFGGRYLVRGGQTTTIDGEPPKPRVIVIAFDSMQKAQAWRNSAAYRALVPVRDRMATVRAYFVEGIDK